ncbi:hypothetical protein W278_00109, partial [Staphylococcus aureus DAR3150]
LIAKVNDSATKGIQQIEIKENEAIQAITATQLVQHKLLQLNSIK